MNRWFKTAGLVSATALALQVASFGATAQPPGFEEEAPLVQAKSLAGVPYRVVRIADLNLAHPAGLETLHARLRAAVLSVCGDAQIQDLNGTREMRKCREAAYEDAMVQVEGALEKVTVAAR